MCYSLSKTFKIARTNMGILIAVMVAGNFDIWQTQEKYPFIYIYIYMLWPIKGLLMSTHHQHYKEERS